MSRPGPLSSEAAGQFLGQGSRADTGFVPLSAEVPWHSPALSLFLELGCRGVAEMLHPGSCGGTRGQHTEGAAGGAGLARGVGV